MTTATGASKRCFGLTMDIYRSDPAHRFAFRDGDCCKRPERLLPVSIKSNRSSARADLQLPWRSCTQSLDRQGGHDLNIVGIGKKIPVVLGQIATQLQNVPIQ
jgi:hypothetical protein